MVYEPNGYGDQAGFDYFEVFYYDNGEKYECLPLWVNTPTV